MLAKLEIETTSPPSDELVDALEGYLASLAWSGQVHRNYLVSYAPLAACAELPRYNALQSRFLSKRGRVAVKRLTDLAGSPPAWELIGLPPAGRSPSWRSASALYLFTHALTHCSPVRAVNFEAGVPLYLLPVSEALREELGRWAEIYREHDSIWLSSGTLEIPAYRELAEPGSELSAHGRRLCRSLEKATGKPTFYYSMRYFARGEGEEERRCPGCSGTWRVDRLPWKATKFARFDFICRRCRLVSHVGVSTGDPARYARIGEPRK